MTPSEALQIIDQATQPGAMPGRHGYAQIDEAVRLIEARFKTFDELEAAKQVKVKSK